MAQPLLNRGSFLLVGRSVLALENVLLTQDLKEMPLQSNPPLQSALMPPHCGCPLLFHQEFSLGFSFPLDRENP